MNIYLVKSITRRVCCFAVVLLLACLPFVFPSFTLDKSDTRMFLIMLVGGVAWVSFVTCMSCFKFNGKISIASILIIVFSFLGGIILVFSMETSFKEFIGVKQADLYFLLALSIILLLVVGFSFGADKSLCLKQSCFDRVFLIEFIFMSGFTMYCFWEFFSMKAGSIHYALFVFILFYVGWGIGYVFGYSCRLLRLN